MLASPSSGRSSRKRPRIIRLKCAELRHLILETKGYDELEDVKRAAAERWVNAVNAEGSYGRWDYRLARKPGEVSGLFDAALRASQII